MSEETHATLRASVEQFRKMINQSSLDGETEHSDVYLNILDDEVRVLQQAPGEVVLTYCSFSEDFFDEIELGVDVSEQTARDSAGDEFGFRAGAEAILDVEQTLTYLGFASDSGTVELSFEGSDNRLATYVRAEGALEAWVKLPGSSDILQDVPHWLPLRFNSENVYTSQAGDPAPVSISTKVSRIETIINAVKEDRDADFYPIVLRDGEFYIDIGDEDRSGVSGTLGAQEVENKTDQDVENYYYDGFEEIFNVLSGPIELQTAPGNNPLSVVQRGSDGRVIRHVNGTVDA